MRTFDRREERHRLITIRDSFVFGSASEAIHDECASRADKLAVQLLKICGEDNEPTDIQAIQQILDLGADIESRDHDNARPLILAAKRKSATIIDFFLARDACILARDGHGWSVLETAIAHDNHDVLNLLFAR